MNCIYEAEIIQTSKIGRTDCAGCYFITLASLFLLSCFHIFSGPSYNFHTGFQHGTSSAQRDPTNRVFFLLTGSWQPGQFV